MSVISTLFLSGETTTSLRKVGGVGNAEGPASRVLLPLASMDQTLSKSAVMRRLATKTMPFGSSSPSVRTVTLSPSTLTTLPSPSPIFREAPMRVTKYLPPKPLVTLSGVAPTARLR
jgi:hypothetical protein